MTTNKVYCGECKYFRAAHWDYHTSEECAHPENLAEKEAKETYRRRARMYIAPDREPYKINMKNDCIWWEAMSEEPAA